MNYRAIAHFVGYVLKAEAVFMLIPLLISRYEREYDIAYGFLFTIAIMMAASLLLDCIKRGNRGVNVKDGFVLVAICWIVLSVFGALPFWFSGEFPSYIDCLFESVSGFTTTGASILTNVESLNKGLIFWRSFTHWIGGMGVLVFLLAFVSMSGSEHTLNVMKAESPGPAPGKLVGNLRQSSKILYGIYLALTITQILLYLAGGMPLFDSLCNAFGTAGTGGFGIKNASIGYYGSVYVDVVTTVFMILFGVNFNIYYFILIRNFRAILKSDELKAYLGIIFASIAVISVNLMGTVYDRAAVSLRFASFQVASIITTTGYATADFNLWPQLSKTVLIILMFIGACGGSTGGGLKVSRVIIIFKEAKRILFRISHPRSVEIVKMDSKAVDKTIVHGVNVYCLTFALVFFVSLLLVSFDNLDFETTFTALASCLNNIGPGMSLVGPNGNFSVFSNFSKIILAIDMLIGRLEIYPILLLFARRTWSKL